MSRLFFRASDGRVARMSYALPAELRDPEFLRALRSLQSHAVPEEGVGYGRRWSTAGRRETVHLSSSGASYSYAGARSRVPLLFSSVPVIERLRVFASEQAGAPFNFALVNFYSSSGALGWHSDNEKDLVPGAPIASVSFSSGPRRFDVRAIEDHSQKWRFLLESGSLLVMCDDSQALTQHCVPKQKLPDDFWRINVTFRCLKE